MKTKITFLLILLPLLCFSQLKIIKRNSIKITYNIKNNLPEQVEYILTSDDIKCMNEFDRSKIHFKSDPLLNNNLNKCYLKSGYDKGHLLPAEDAEQLSCKFKNIYQESFYFSNVAPQAPLFNRNGWRFIETDVRQLALNFDSLKVITGTIVISNKKIKNIVIIPDYFYKVIYIKKTNKLVVYLFENKNLKYRDYKKNIVNITEVEKLIKNKISYLF